MNVIRQMSFLSVLLYHVIRNVSFTPCRKERKKYVNSKNPTDFETIALGIGLYDSDSDLSVNRPRRSRPSTRRSSSLRRYTTNSCVRGTCCSMCNLSCVVWNILLWVIVLLTTTLLILASSLNVHYIFSRPIQSPESLLV